MSKIFNEVSNYIPYTTLRSINRNYNKNDKEYCKKAAFIYKDDMLYINTAKANKIIYYNDIDTFGILTMENVNYIYRIYEKDDNVVLSIRVGKNDINDIIDIDILSKYKILKNRGCEDIIPNYARNNIKKLLLQTFKNNLNPDNVHEIMYLYMYLHSNCILMGHPQSLDTKTLKINIVPSQAFMDEIYDMYNLIYVRLTLL